MKYIKFVLVIVLFAVCFVIARNYSLTYDSSEKNTTDAAKTLNKGKLLKTVALLADSHVDYERLSKALKKAKNYNTTLLIHFGDLSDFGGSEELSRSKQLLQSSGIDYLVIPGDRDVVENGVNFKKLFDAKVCSSQLLNNYKILCLSNPYNYTLLDSFYLQSVYDNFSKADILFISQPIYNPNSNVYMGFYDENVKFQADEIHQKVIDSSIKYVFSGDAHFFTKYKDGNTTYYNLGAVTDKRNLQTPNFTILNIYENTIEVKQVNID